MSKIAIVIGATGLVGKEVVRLLIVDPNVSQVLVLHRRSIGVTHPKLTEHIVDFDQPQQWAHLVKGDVLYSTMGTTLKQAGSQEAQYKIDYTYQYQTAQIAASNGVANYVLVSSTGARPKSRLFYPRMKGELEEAIKHLDFKQIDIIRPSILLGERPEYRFGERMGAALMNVLKLLPAMRKYRGIKGSEVAQAMINASMQKSKYTVRVHELEGVFDLLE